MSQLPLNCPGNCVLWFTICKETLCCNRASHPQMPEAAARRGYVEERRHGGERACGGEGQSLARTATWHPQLDGEPVRTGCSPALLPVQACVQVSCGAHESTPAPSPLRPHSGCPDTPRDAVPTLVLGWWVASSGNIRASQLTAGATLGIRGWGAVHSALCTELLLDITGFDLSEFYPPLSCDCVGHTWSASFITPRLDKVVPPGRTGQPTGNGLPSREVGGGRGFVPSGLL